MISEQQQEILIKFGRHLEYLRKQKNLSYRKIAQNCDIDYSDISKIEKGEKNITLLTILELAQGLEVEAAELMRF